MSLLGLPAEQAFEKLRLVPRDVSDVDYSAPEFLPPSWAERQAQAEEETFWGSRHSDACFDHMGDLAGCDGRCLQGVVSWRTSHAC